MNQLMLFESEPDQVVGQQLDHFGDDDLSWSNGYGLIVQIIGRAEGFGSGGYGVGITWLNAGGRKRFWRLRPEGSEQEARLLADYAVDRLKRRARRWGPPRGATPQEKSVWMALHSFQDAPMRWAALRASGADDARLKEQIGRELGIAGGQSGRLGAPGNEHRGGKNPRITVLSRRPVVFSGRKLVDLARRLFEIPNRDD